MAIYYISIMALTGSGCLFAKKKDNKALVCYLTLSASVLILIASFRYAVGFDYFSYRRIYEKVATQTFEEIIITRRSEPLLYLLCKIFCLMGCSYHTFLFCINTFLLIVAMRFIYQYSKLPWFSVYLYITLQFLAYNMNLVRQSVAVSFFLLAYPYIRERKLIPYTILIIIGGLFHNSLFIMWPLYIFLPIKGSRKLFVGLTIITILGYIAFDPIFAIIQPIILKNYNNYSQSYFWQPSSITYVIPSVVYTVLIYLFRDQIDPSRRSTYLNSAIYQCIITLFITKHFILERFAIYPFALSLLAIPEIIATYREKDRKQKIGYRQVMLLFLLFGAAYFFFAAVKGYHGVYPYISLLKKSHSIPIN